MRNNKTKKKTNLQIHVLRKNVQYCYITFKQTKKKNNAIIKDQQNQCENKRPKNTNAKTKTNKKTNAKIKEQKRLMLKAKTNKKTNAKMKDPKRPKKRPMPK